MIIKTKRLVLRFIRRGDEPSFARYLNNKKIYRCLAKLPFPYTMRHAKAWVNLNVKNNRRKKKKDVVFVIDHNGKFVGVTGLHRISGHKCDFGYWIAEPFWGNGFATEAVKAVTKFAFQKLGLVRIAAATYLFNKRSMRVLKKCGFKKEGHLRKAFLKNKRLYDLYLFSKIKNP